MKRLLLLSILIMGTILAGCSSTKEVESISQTHTEKLKIYTTIFPLQDFTNKIGGDFVDVKSIYPPNVDAHSFEPSTKDMINLAKADLFIYTGAGIEGFTEKAAEALKNEKVVIVRAVEGIRLLEMNEEHSHAEESNSKIEIHEEDADHSEEEHHEEEADHSEEEHIEAETSDSKEDNKKNDSTHSGENEDHAEHGNYDPHVWLDPSLSIQIASNIKDSLIELMPEKKTEFEDNYKMLEKELTALDNEFKQVIDNSKTKYLLVAHDAYGYWANRYGIKQIAVNGLSPTQEPTQRELADIIKESKEHQIKYIAFEQNVSPRVAEIIQKEIGASALTLNNLESITEEDVKNNEDYFSLMRKNLETLKKALN
ncbi:metal ABC transporter substrate-binding protein [Mesobacillus subterraneus]|uniref:metal ABC transporter substrate-binding protein n=1 Tax=Mesobacillus subterraneus TaxID=285983 RepID=UPI00203AEE29|nr:metal ABC transporter substrate-binding protein [Mesobacillus subterraneus]MCM3666207.1 metal ABC transporter substrate-binding protein [Mesobacillus subterraneus]MCM3685206.1 metal ABC transporter substrate-binding protein [Mesobacillus subterraneus]